MTPESVAESVACCVLRVACCVLRVNLITTYDMFSFQRPKLIMYLPLYCITSFGIDSGAENGSFEDRGESGTEAKALLCATRIPVERHRHIMLKWMNGHYLFCLTGVVFPNICLVMIL